jgi:hypothetical protein
MPIELIVASMHVRVLKLQLAQHYPLPTSTQMNKSNLLHVRLPLKPSGLRAADDLQDAGCTTTMLVSALVEIHPRRC